jgi:hypothetical protein
MMLLYAYFQLPAALLSYSLVALTTLVLYVLACDPLPPQRAKLREWLATLWPAPSGPAPEQVLVRPDPGARGRRAGSPRTRVLG